MEQQQDLTESGIVLSVVLVHDGVPSSEMVSLAEEFHNAFTSKGVDYQFGATPEQSGYQCVPKNLGTYNAPGDYICYLDYDNEWSKDHVVSLATAIREGERWPDFTYGRRRYVFEDGFTSDKVHEGESSLVEWNELAKSRLEMGPHANFIDTSDVMIAKGSLWHLHMKTGSMWNEELRRFADWEMIWRGAKYASWRGKAVDKVLQTYYWHGNNVQLTRPASEIPKPVGPEVINQLAGKQ